MKNYRIYLAVIGGELLTETLINNLVNYINSVGFKSKRVNSNKISTDMPKEDIQKSAKLLSAHTQNVYIFDVVA